MRAVLQYHISRVLRRDHRDLGWISVVSQTKSCAEMARGLSRAKRVVPTNQMLTARNRGGIPLARRRLKQEIIRGIQFQQTT